ncbi:DUF4302 domain-containing protein [Capnocytophaga sp.]|uniref:DUF4302 domain-containing protein n=1 Tax=Capnocytophaga sp. TaxID=44737 RepID=UPI0026DDC20D|nr:DUF4302 domain-containing protein [Capnocytophaga sp.]MDO5105583.1 DUF4302 domain-containing protein [Capnocytophaga sp.]
MKKITQFLALTIAFLVVGACSNKFEEELFDGTASERMQKSIADLQKKLTASANGWAFEYYPGGKERLAQGHMYTLKFTETQVTAMLDVYAGLAIASAYSVKPNGGVTLSFDEYNPLLHSFAEPSSGAYNGQLADFEFSLVSITDDVILLKGKKYHSVMRLVKLTESPETFINKVSELNAYVKARGFAEFLVNGKEIKFTRPANIVFTYLDENQETKSIATTYLYTDKGIRFYEPITINGTTFQELMLNKDTNSLTSQDGKTTLGLLYPAPLDMVNSTWQTELKNPAKSSDAFTALFDQMDLLNNQKMAAYRIDVDLLRVIDFGGAYKGIRFFSTLKSDPNRGYETIFELNFTGGKKQGELGMSLLKAGKNWGAFSHLAPLRDFFVNNAPYKIEPNDPANPTSVKLTSAKNPDVWFVLDKR